MTITFYDCESVHVRFPEYDADCLAVITGTETKVSEIFDAVSDIFPDYFGYGSEDSFTGCIMLNGFDGFCSLIRCFSERGVCIGSN